jgi:hypothetical protein
MAGNTMFVELIETGGKQGFSGNYLSDYKSIYETLVDFTVDFGKRSGLAIMDKSEAVPSKES